MKKAFIYNVMAITSLIGSVIMAGSCTKTPAETKQTISLNLTYGDWESGKPAINFNDGDKAGVFATANGHATLNAERIIDNVCFTNQNGTFVSSPKISAEKETEYYFVSYVPYSQNILNAGTNTGTVSVSSNQSNIAEYAASDFMIGNTTVKPEDDKENILIQMNRMFAHICLSLSSNNKNESFEDAIITLDMHSEATVDFDNATITGTAKQETMTPRGKFAKDGDVWSGARLIAIPQVKKGSEEFISLTLGGKTNRYALGEDLVLASGIQYNVTIHANKIGDKYEVGFTVEEEPWSNGLDLSFEVNEDAEKIEPVTDIDGNIYTVVKIGAQYWMASNLRTTKYNDGTPISRIDSNAEWDGVSETKEGAYCVYNNNDEFIEKYGFLYNWHTIETGKLCPEGWHIPTMAEYEMLFKLAGGRDLAGEFMKSTHSWRDYRNEEQESYQGTDEWGFCGLPGGYRFSDGKYSNEGKYGYWWTASCPNDARADAIYLYYNKPNTSTISAFHRTGYSVRCVKY